MVTRIFEEFWQFAAHENGIIEAELQYVPASIDVNTPPLKSVCRKMIQRFPLTRRRLIRYK